ncbi:General secretion pathway protein A [hydrothermal vent metagenome]|uniref:General secretion pathway protein A n=1 Tax=hydrothermal vent metagenome TaxID=652676 RepID=A0A3B0Y8U8_9ZZZZ
MTQTLLARYGLKWNPFSSDIPIEALYRTPKVDSFCWRVEKNLLREGGFAMISGEPGTGKSVTLRLLAQRLNEVRDVSVGVISLPSGRLADFYREMGDLFGIELSPHNRWGGFRKLRERWAAHQESTLTRPVLLIDEAQEAPAAVLNELRLLSSAEFDSRHLLSVVLAGDKRLNNKLRHEDLLPLGSRIRTRLSTEYATREDLTGCLKHLLQNAGNATLMSDELITMLSEHAIGNYRVLIGMAAELLSSAVEQELTHLDEKLYFQCFAAPTSAKKKTMDK